MKSKSLLFDQTSDFTKPERPSGERVVIMV